MNQGEYEKLLAEGAKHVRVISASGVLYDIDHESVLDAINATDLMKDNRLYVYGYRVNHGKRQRGGRYISAGSVKWFYLDSVNPV